MAPRFLDQEKLWFIILDLCLFVVMELPDA